MEKGEIDSSIAYYRVGPASESAVLFLHGNSFNKSVFIPQLEFLKDKEIQAIAIDFPGHGSSSYREQNETYSFGYFVKAIEKTVEHFKIKNLIIVGQSIGGNVAIEAAVKLREKNLIKALFIFGTIPYSKPLSTEGYHDTEALPYYITERISDEQYLIMAEACFKNKELASDFAPLMKKTDARFRKEIIENAFFGHFEDQFSYVQDSQVPVLTVIAKDDEFVVNEYVKTIYKNPIVEIDGGHFSNLDNPSEFNQVMMSFIESNQTLTNSSSTEPHSPAFL